MNNQLPDYVEYGPRETAPPPFVAEGGNFLGLILKGDTDAIEDLCDRVLNRPFDGGNTPSPFTYKPFSDAVLLFVGRWEGLTSTPMIDRGSSNEDEVSLWVPLKKWDRHGRERGVCVMVPYMFVDNPMSLLNGREDYGYPKASGRFEPSPLPGRTAAAPDSVAVKAFGGVYSRNSVADWVDVLRVDPVPATAPLDLASPPEESPFPAVVLGEILRDGVNQVFLKQFRDAEWGGSACYQRLVEAPVTFEQPQVRLKPGQWRVEIQIQSPCSHPITEDLGIQTHVTPFAFELHSGLRLEPGTVIV